MEVSAAALTLDTTSETQTTVLTGGDLQTLPSNGRDFTQLIRVTPGFGGYSAGGFGSLNGTRANQVNWQIDGVDNNDLWHNVPAVNQGGVSGIAGIVLPIDAVDQFSVQTQAAPESGRNPGGTVDLALKSGGNDLHGSAYYYVRNEAFAAASPFVAIKEGKSKLQLRIFCRRTLHQGSPVLSSPPLRSRGSRSACPDWEPNLPRHIRPQALAELAKFGVAVNPVSANLLANLWPSYALNGPAVAKQLFQP